MSGSSSQQTLVHVIFADGGVPAWFGPEPTTGSELVDLADLSQFVPDGVSDLANTAVWRQILITHCRIDGQWLPRAFTQVMPEGEAGAASAIGTESDGSGDALSDPAPSEAEIAGQEESQAS